MDSMTDNIKLIISSSLEKSDTGKSLINLGNLENINVVITDPKPTKGRKRYVKITPSGWRDGKKSMELFNNTIKLLERLIK